MSTKTSNRRPTAPQTKPRTNTTPDHPHTVDLHKRPHLTLTKNPAPTKAALPTRPWMTDAQGYATLAALLADITTPHLSAWTDIGNDNATRPHTDGTLTYQHATHTLTWTATCPQGTHHNYPITAPGDLKAARTHLAWCQDRHTPTSPVRSLADAFGHDTDRTLADSLTRSDSGTTDTQPLTAAAIRAGLEARTQEADTDQPKEHPEP
ncbi:hypothetical protein ACFQ0X_44005 [Streptomyces rectiviolaceus]|uniref:Uncharacterized protein n=1 Tax=Streptomyces rectiviolaceus TaxID=332591 RepID=A0ABP6NNW1_9ACTN